MIRLVERGRTAASRSRCARACRPSRPSAPPHRVRDPRARAAAGPGCSRRQGRCRAGKPWCGGSVPSPTPRGGACVRSMSTCGSRRAAAQPGPEGQPAGRGGPAAGRCTGSGRGCTGGSRPGRRMRRPSDVHHLAVSADRAVGPRRPGRQPGPQRSGRPGDAGSRTGRGRGCRARRPAARRARFIRQPRYSNGRSPQASDQLGVADPGDVAHIEPSVDNVGDGQHPDHTVIVRCETRPADGPARDGFPDAAAASAQCSLGAVDLGLRYVVAGRQRADLQPLAGGPEQVEVGAADRAQLGTPLAGTSVRVSRVSSSARRRRSRAASRSIGSAGARVGDVPLAAGESPWCCSWCLAQLRVLLLF